VALLGSVFSAGFQSSMKPAVQDLPAEIAEPASEGIAKAFGVAQQAGDNAARIIDAAKHALVDGWVRAMWVGAGMGAVILLVVALRGPVRVRATDTSAVELELELEPEPSA
jgi:pimeloyl-ACP methyl ester carboxylesterase